MSDQVIRHPFCDFALTRDELSPGISIAQVGILLMPQFWETDVVYVEAGADWLRTADGYNSILSSMGIVPYKNGDWAPRVTFLNTSENRQEMFDLLLVEETLVAAESAVAMARAHLEQFGNQILKAKDTVKRLRPAGHLELVIRPI